MDGSFDGSQNIGVCIVVMSGNSILIGIRKNAYRSGAYGLPGGRLEVGEPLETCARRELLEETGLTAVTVQYGGIVREWQGSYDFIHVVYFCREWVGEPKVMEPDKCEEWEWIKNETLPATMISGHIAAVRLAFKQSENPNYIDLPKH